MLYFYRARYGMTYVKTRKAKKEARGKASNEANDRPYGARKSSKRGCEVARGGFPLSTCPINVGDDVDPQ